MSRLEYSSKHATEYIILIVCLKRKYFCKLKIVPTLKTVYLLINKWRNACDVDKSPTITIKKSVRDVFCMTL